jgi:hypothetical protein
MITRKRAAAIAAEWHSGQWSALYIVSCGNLTKLDCADLDRAICALDADIRYAERVELRGQGRSLRALRRLLETRLVRELAADLAS